ncbi:pectinesterase precursor [Penicillium malachiteum]|nr:pectinesterase precursor [Penicillium malachiteum]
MIMKLTFTILVFPPAWVMARNTPPAGSIVVAKSGGDYDTLIHKAWIGKAIMALDTGHLAEQTIFIKEGVYDEQVEIPTLRGGLLIYGETLE